MRSLQLAMTLLAKDQGSKVLRQTLADVLKQTNANKKPKKKPRAYVSSRHRAAFVHPEPCSRNISGQPMPGLCWGSAQNATSSAR
ncbi:Uncharacterised protein [Klebsiella pneumoniae]|uniref:Uncharacterized protein n=1 Tax=Klebsiella pneumoniae TaxID=573 RepID=A0A2X3DD37_KLEPN|nr:Uncharacterised protein [Klebsiella pneumoniae]